MHSPASSTNSSLNFSIDSDLNKVKPRAESRSPRAHEAHTSRARSSSQASHPAANVERWRLNNAAYEGRAAHGLSGSRPRGTQGSPIPRSRTNSFKLMDFEEWAKASSSTSLHAKARTPSPKADANSTALSPTTRKRRASRTRSSSNGHERPTAASSKRVHATKGTPSAGASPALSGIDIPIRPSRSAERRPEFGHSEDRGRPTEWSDESVDRSLSQAAAKNKFVRGSSRDPQIGSPAGSDTVNPQVQHHCYTVMNTIEVGTTSRQSRTSIPGAARPLSRASSGQRSVSTNAQNKGKAPIRPTDQAAHQTEAESHFELIFGEQIPDIVRWPEGKDLSNGDVIRQTLKGAFAVIDFLYLALCAGRESFATLPHPEDEVQTWHRVCGKLIRRLEAQLNAVAGAWTCFTGDKKTYEEEYEQFRAVTISQLKAAQRQAIIYQTRAEEDEPYYHTGQQFTRYGEDLQPVVGYVPDDLKQFEVRESFKAYKKMQLVTTAESYVGPGKMPSIVRKMNVLGDSTENRKAADRLMTKASTLIKEINLELREIDVRPHAISGADTQTRSSWTKRASQLCGRRGKCVALMIEASGVVRSSIERDNNEASSKTSGHDARNRVPRVGS